MTKDGWARIGWTALQVAVPSVAYAVDLLPAAWIPVGTIALAAIKNLVADHFKTKE